MKFTLIFIVCISIIGKYNEIQFDKPYKFSASNQSISLTLNSDSSYNYYEWNHLGSELIDSGKWKIDCNYLLLNSDGTSFILKKKKKEIRPIFDNSAFKILNKDTLLYDKGYSKFYLKAQ